MEAPQWGTVQWGTEWQSGRGSPWAVFTVVRKGKERVKTIEDPWFWRTE